MESLYLATTGNFLSQELNRFNPSQEIITNYIVVHVHSILFYSIRLPKFIYGHGKEDESGLSSCDLLGSDAGTGPPDDPLH